MTKYIAKTLARSIHGILFLETAERGSIQKERSANRTGRQQTSAAAGSYRLRRREGAVYFLPFLAGFLSAFFDDAFLESGLFSAPQFQSHCWRLETQAVRRSTEA